jgi:L,D-transpeptidase catalytic domain
VKFIFITLFSLFSCDNTHVAHASFTNGSIKAYDNAEIIRIQSFVPEAKKFCTAHGFNNKTFFLADMHLHSGKKRLFVYDMKADSIVTASMVAHGACGYNFLQDAKFSNESGCGCSSLGKYKIGNKYNGRFGTAYKLYGLDSSNSNVFTRCIVLHSYYLVPDKETYPDPICNSLGCPMVSPNFLKELEIKIDKSSKPILLWIVN